MLRVPCRPLLALIAAAALPVPQARGGGVTLITHGFNSDITSWILPMASRFPGHPGFPGTQLTCYEIEITASGGGFAATATRLDGPAPDASDSCEIVVKLRGFTVTGSPGQRLRIEATESLGNWQGIATRTLDGPTWIFSDPDTALHPKRFYRVVPGP